MGCFSIAWIAQLAIWLVVVVAVFAIIKILVPWIASKLGADGAIAAQIISICLWTAIAIAVILIVASLLACVLTGPGLLPHR